MGLYLSPTTEHLTGHQTRTDEENDMDDSDDIEDSDPRVTVREDCVFAALETSARLRGRDTTSSAGATAMDAIDRTIATIEAESARS